MTFPPKTRVLLLLTGLAAYWIVIFVGTHVPGSVIHPGGHKDKVFHFGAFVGLSILLCWCVAFFRKPGPAVYAAVVAVAACYGVFDELTQQFVPIRTADPLDWLADLCGAVLGTALFALAWQMMQRRYGTTG